MSASTRAGAFGGIETEEFRAMNPNARVPVIENDGTIVWESHAIVRFLAAKFGAGALWPEDAAVRSYSDRWMDWVLADLQPAFLSGVFWNFYRTPDAQRNWPAIRQGIARSAILFRMLDLHLADKPFIAGDTLTIGDIAVGAQLFRYFELEIDRPVIPNVKAWYERLSSRPAYREHVMIPFEDLRGRLAF